MRLAGPGYGDHAFERRRLFGMDASRAAIGRIGGTEEGIFRQHLITASGRVRDTVYFSILDSEWPTVRARLQARLADGPESKNSRTPMKV